MASVSYNKLFKLLIDKRMQKGELVEKADITYPTLRKMYNGENVSADILVRICKALDCNIEDIMEILPG